MEKCKEILALIKHDIEHQEEIIEIFSEAMHELREANEEAFDEIFEKLYILAYGEHLNQKSAEHWVTEMKNFDNTTGGKWTKMETDSVAKQAGIDFEHTNYNAWEWYAVMNMLHSDFGGIITDISNYIKIARAWLEDKDADSGKTYRYYHNVYKH